MRIPFRETHLLAFLNRFDKEKKPLDGALSDYLRQHKSIGAHDRRFLGDAAYALVRWKSLLDYLGASTWEQRHRRFQEISLRELPKTLPDWVRCGASEWLFSELTAAYGRAKAEELCLALNEPAPLTVRANLLKTTREELLARWQSLEAEACGRSPAGIRFRKRIALTQMKEFRDGLFEIQDEGSQLVADLVRASPKDHVLDFCSGSGGKSLAIAPRMNGQGQIYLHDVRPQILHEAKRRFRRAGVQNAQFLPPLHPHLERLKGNMDWVLADVPCSGSGTFRRNPDMKWKVDGPLIERLVQTQREIVATAVEYVKPGGFLVYATCSIFPKENTEQADYFLSRLPLTREGDFLSLHPAPNGPDGFFAAVFRRHGK